MQRLRGRDVRLEESGRLLLRQEGRRLEQQHARQHGDILAIGAAVGQAKPLVADSEEVPVLLIARRLQGVSGLRGGRARAATPLENSAPSILGAWGINSDQDLSRAQDELGRFMADHKGEDAGPKPLLVSVAYN